MRYPKRLIEVDLPIRRISEHARREKSIRHGHISTLHIWWARRPLAACRAVLCAALWPDPGDELCPDTFKVEAKQQMLAWATKYQNLMSGESLKHFNQLAQNPDLINRDEILRQALLDFIADFANWDNSKKSEYLETARALTQISHESLGGTPGSHPLVADPFAGGGSIPLEALRVGAEAFASDLNPVAVMLNKVMIEFIPKFGNSNIEIQDIDGNYVTLQGLAEAVKFSCNKIKQEAEKELEQFYSKEGGTIPIVYLWARTIISEAPDDGTGIPVEIPLIRSFWLAKKGKKQIALRWVRDDKGLVKTEIVKVDYHNGTTKSVKRPLLEIFEPIKASEVEQGPVAKGSATCPVTGFTTPVTSVRKQLRERKGGTQDARLFCVVELKPSHIGRFYRLPNPNDYKGIEKAKIYLKKKLLENKSTTSLIPNEKIENLKGRFNIYSYGIQSWGELFSQRQLASITFFNEKIEQMALNAKASNSSVQFALALCLSIVLNRQIDALSSNASWRPMAECQRNTFARQSLPFIWDFAEINPISDSTGNFMGAADWVIKVIRENQNIYNSGIVELSSATKHPLPNDSISCFFTDPPYYDSVPYADLSDFFYCWFKRSLKSFSAPFLSGNLTNKSDEIVYISHICSAYSERTSSWFENQMQVAMSEGRRILAPNGIGVVVFAHKSTSGWETQLQAMLDAGWIFTGSWPIDTERASRTIAIGSAALASSIHLVCRPRENPDGSLITDFIGDWRDVLAELPKRMHEWMPRLAQEGVVGADAIFACLGPALEIFSRYSSVEKASGEKVALGEYLEHVWAAVSKEALNMIFEGADTSGFEEDARLTAMWLWTLNANASDTGAAQIAEESDDDDDDTGSKSSKRGFALEYDAARKIAQGLGAHLEQLAHLVEVKGSEARLLPVSERGGYLFGKQPTAIEQVKGKKAKAKNKQANIFELFDSTGTDSGDVPAQGFSVEAIAPDLQVSAGKSVLDRIHQCMILFATGQSDSLRRFLVEEGIGRDERFWKLAQALSALYPQGTDEKRWVDGVLVRKKGLGF